MKAMQYKVSKTRHGKWASHMPNGTIAASFIAERSAINHANAHNEGISPLTQRIAELESVLKQIELNAPKERPANPAEWQMFIAGQLARSALEKK